jgi:hypothetical protein
MNAVDDTSRALGGEPHISGMQKTVYIAFYYLLFILLSFTN